ncbi:MAG: hypothetical protein KF889_03250 [Alphaproteobacteria bacterium]|nr:hypothetical protein [Alphaproteobacteria bacterium]
MLITEVRVVRHVGDTDHDARGAAAIFDSDAFPNSFGRVVEGWMEGDPRMTPDGIFAGMLVDGFASTKSLIQALREFALVEECDWARRFLAAMPADVPMDD